MIPIWGNGRAAIDDFQNGKYGWGTVYAALAISDVFLVKAAATAVAKGGAELLFVVTKKALEEGGGEELTAKGGTRLLEAAKIQQHHIFPRQFEDFFAKRGVEIDDFTVPLTRGQHLKAVHGTGDTLSPGRWNQVWEEFIRANPNATAKDIYQQAGRMMDEFGLSGQPIAPY
jgi:hypothetical protein